MPACKQGAQWPRALTLLVSMDHAVLEPGIITYNLAIGAGDKGAEWQHVLSLSTTMGLVVGNSPVRCPHLGLGEDVFNQTHP